MSSHIADRNSSGIAGVAAPALAAAVAALPGRSVALNGDHLASMAAARDSTTTASDANEVTGKATGGSGAYIYGYDSAGNPTLTDAANSCSSDHTPPH